MPLKIHRKIKNRWILLKTGTNMEYNMSDNLIDVSCAYPKGQGHGSHIYVLQNTSKFVEKD
jgi:hypothetical protein